MAVRLEPEFTSAPGLGFRVADRCAHVCESRDLDVLRAIVGSGFTSVAGADRGPASGRRSASALEPNRDVGIKKLPSAGQVGTWHTRALLEGIKSLLQSAKAQARGYRSDLNFITMAYLIAGKLDLGLPT